MEPDELVELGRGIRTLARRAQLVIGRSTEIEALPPTEEEVLAHVVHHPGCRVQDVADALLLAPANASAVVSRLVRRGLLFKTPDGQDGRVVRLHPSEVAEGERQRLDSGAGDVYRAVVSQLGEDEQRVLREAVPVIWRMAEVLARTGGGVGTDDGQSTR